MKTEERRSRIIELLERRGSVAVDELAETFAVSLVTVRKDLSELEARGLLHRTHGGATYAHKSLFNPSFREKLHLQQAEKAAVARLALEFIEEGDSVILDAGTTTLLLAQIMKTRLRSVYVITNSVPVALELGETGWEILLTGGQVRHHSMALIGPATVRTLEGYHADKAFVSATGVSARRGYTTPNPYEAETKRAMIAAVDTVYALVDSSKLGLSTLASFAALGEVDVLLTDAKAPEGFLREMDRQGLAYRLGELEATEQAG
jgi:DeoR family transcriptional regulator of aga operon/DeoR family fructose operon transcriptional repressor